MNSRELDLDNFTYNRKDRTNKNGGGWIVYFHDYVKYERMAMAFLRHTMGTVILISKPRRLVFISYG
jgi:hypothetical protein